MTAVRQYVLHCDHPACRGWVKIEEPTLTDARRKARRAWGWRTRTDRSAARPVLQDICNNHQR